MNLAATLGLAAALLLGLGACQQSAVTAPGRPASSGKGAAVLGLIEVTVSGLGSSQPHSAVKTLQPVGPLSLAEQSGGLQLQALTTSVFNLGDRNAGTGQRFITVTFKVRNADSLGAPSATERSNLTLLAAAVADTQDGSAVRAMQTFGGTPVNTGLARGILPTHAMVFQPPTTSAALSSGGEDFQVYSESEVLPTNFTRPSGPVTAYSDLGVTTIFPYGYVVRHLGGAGAASRTLAANPAADQYDGRVAVSVVLPLQKDDASKTPVSGAARDPFSFSMIFVIVADPVTSVTQSLGEQGSPALVGARASAAAASQINVLPGSTLAPGLSGGVTTRRICQVRTAGLITDVSPAPTYLVNQCP